MTTQILALSSPGEVRVAVVRGGELLALLGPNGAGKTTTIDMVLGLSRPDAGAVEVHGMAPRAAVAHGLVAAVMQTGGLLKELTVRETVELTAALFAHTRPVAEVLERESYQVVPALSADEALAKLDEVGPFDAVLTDLRMPVRSGLDLLRALRERDPAALVLVLTAFGDAAAAGEAIRAGAYDFISKPYDIAALRETLARALGRRRLAGVRRGPSVGSNGAAAAASRAAGPARAPRACR